MSLTQFEKICGFWAETYRRLLEACQALRAERWRRLAFEDIPARRVNWADLFSFLHMDFPGADLIEEVVTQDLNRQETGDVPPPEAWSAAQCKILEDFCGPTARAWDIAV